MENESRLKQWKSSVFEFLSEQPFVQQLKTKWEELDPNSRQYLKVGGAGATVLLLLIFVISSVWSVHSLKKELNEKQELLSTIQTANEELRRLREVTSSLPSAGGGSGVGAWPSYFETVGASTGIDKASLNVGDEKPGAEGETAKETLFDVSVKHVSIKQVVRYAFGLENGTRPVKLRNLSIDTKADPAGYMDATFSVSGFAMVNK